MARSIADKLLMRQNEFLSHLGEDFASFSSQESDFCLTSRESHHRIKNNLQMVASLINLQAQQAEHPEVKAALLLALARLETFTRLHETLSHHEQNEQVDLLVYFKELVAALRAVMGMRAITPGDDTADNASTAPGLGLHLEVPEITVPSSLAVDMGMTLNELVTNARKHAFPDSDGEIHIVCEKNGQYLDLYVTDNGQGIKTEISSDMPEQDDHSKSLGMAIVRQFAAKYHSRFTLSPQDCGTRAHIRFPLPSQDKNS